MTKPLTDDQGPAFQAHSLQMTLLGPFTYEPNVILGSLNNRVPTQEYLVFFEFRGYFLSFGGILVIFRFWEYFGNF